MHLSARPIAHVTGAASGLGRHTALRLAARGTDLALYDLEEPAQTARQARDVAVDEGQRVIACAADVTDAARLAEAVTGACARIGAPTLSLHFAGITGPWTFDEMSAEQFERVIAVNLLGTRNWLAAIRPHIGRGHRAVVTASVSSFVGSYGYTSYAASKAGVWGLLTSLRCEWAPQGIDLTVFAPPPVATPLTAAEVGVMHPAGLTMKEFAGHMDIDDAVTALLRGIDRGAFLVMPGARAKATRLATRLLPMSLVNAVTDRRVRRASAP